MRVSPLPLRLALYVFLPLFVVLVLGAILVLSSLERQFERRMQQEVAMVARALQPTVSRALARGEGGALRTALESASAIGRVYGAYVLDQDGALVASTGRVPSEVELERAPSPLVSGRRAGAYGEVAGRSVYSYFVPLTGAGGRIIGLLQVTRRKSDFRRFMGDLRVRAGITLVLALGLFGGIGLLGYHGAAGKALRALRRSMERVESGERDHRALVRGPREVSTIAQALNTMLDAMAEAEDEVRSERESRTSLERQLRRSEELAALGQLAAGVAHELGTPLSVINGRAQRALRDPDLAFEIRDLLDGTRQEVLRMEAIVRQLLDFARGTESARSVLGADQLVVLAVNALDEERRSHGVTLEIDGAEPAPQVLVASTRAQQALVNVGKNAIQAARSRVRFTWERRGAHVVFGVDDDGPGVGAELEDRLFEPFFTTKAPEEGTGLGLAIAHSVAAEHDGAIAIASSALGGARFEIGLPLAPAAWEGS